MARSVQTEIAHLLEQEATARRQAAAEADPRQADDLLYEAERLADAAWSLGEEADAAYVPSDLWLKAA